MSKIVSDSSTYYEDDKIDGSVKRTREANWARGELSEQVASELRPEYQEVA